MRPQRSGRTKRSATLPNPSVDLGKIEKAFINAIMPPVNKRDLEATIGAAKAAAF